MENIQILVTCQQCDAENTLTIAQGENGVPACSKCHRVLLNYATVNGYIYILSNPKMGGLLKIGFSARPVEERIAELNSATGMPAPFVLEAFFLSTNPQGDEKQIHSKLSEQRIPGKEFFALPTTEALKVVQSICGRAPAYLDKEVAATVISSQQTVSQSWESSLREKLRNASTAKK
ncbi:MAG TPA: GIY-YIG nuclease family protein [Candidatus Binatia bacterium]|nr:GIY-YIG nuclease family protein [Candidatus Binatia bacterium]